MTSRMPRSGSSWVNGHLPRTIVPSTSTDVVSARDMMALTGSTRVGSCAGWTGNASTFSKSYKDFLRKHWAARLRKDKGGFSGLGRRSKRMSGVIRRAWQMGGFLRIPVSGHLWVKYASSCVIFYDLLSMKRPTVNLQGIPL